jgi:NADH-quinone oxidoreductase subunit G
MPLAHSAVMPAAGWAQALADIAAAIAAEKGVAPLVQAGHRRGQGHRPIAAGRRTQGRAAGQRRRAPCQGASSLLALANWIGQQTGASVGYLTEAANTVGAQLVGAHAGAMAA